MSAFHLNNKLANYIPTIIFCEYNINHNPIPKYLRITLDQSLTYKTHLTNIAAKISTRNNIIQKLVGTHHISKCYLSRKDWVIFNRIRTKYGKCRYLIHHTQNISSKVRLWPIQLHTEQMLNKCREQKKKIIL